MRVPTRTRRSRSVVGRGFSSRFASIECTFVPRTGSHAVATTDEVRGDRVWTSFAPSNTARRRAVTPADGLGFEPARGETLAGGHTASYRSEDVRPLRGLRHRGKSEFLSVSCVNRWGPGFSHTGAAWLKLTQPSRYSCRSYSALGRRISVLSAERTKE